MKLQQIHTYTHSYTCARIYTSSIASHKHMLTHTQWEWETNTSQARIQTTQNNQYIFDVKREHESFMNSFFFVVFVVVVIVIIAVVVVVVVVVGSSTILLFHTSLSVLLAYLRSLIFNLFPFPYQCLVNSDRIPYLFLLLFQFRSLPLSPFPSECKPLENRLRRWSA